MAVTVTMAATAATAEIASSDSSNNDSCYIATKFHYQLKTCIDLPLGLIKTVFVTYPIDYFPTSLIPPTRIKTIQSLTEQESTTPSNRISSKICKKIYQERDMK